MKIKSLLRSVANLNFVMGLFVLSVVLAPRSVRADAYLRLGAMYLSTSVEQGGSTSEASRLLIDVGGGYVNPKGWTIGGLYSTESSDAEPQAYGVTAGWITRKEMGFYTLGTYFVSSKSNGYESGWGYQADLGYRITLRKLTIAPQISYKSHTYDITGSEETVTVTHVDPMLVVFFDF